MLLKKSLSLLLCTCLTLSLCLFALPKTARAAATSVKLSPSGTSEVVLNSTTPYLINNVADSSGTLGSNGCTAYFHGNTLEIQGLDINGTARLGPINSIRSGIYADGDLTILVRGGGNRVSMPSYDADQARAVFVRNGSLTLVGDGSLEVSVGTGYSSPSYAVACGTEGETLTVNNGVTLSATMNSSNPSNAAIYAIRLSNSGSITAMGAGTVCGMHLCNISGVYSENYGSLSSTSSGGSALKLSSNHAFRVLKGTVELTSAAGSPVICNSGSNSSLYIDPSITDGLMGASSSSASVCSSGFIMANCIDNAAYSYLRLHAAPPTPSGSVHSSAGDGGPSYNGSTYTGSYSVGANGSIIYTVQADCKKLVSVTVDGAQLKQGADYTVECGSTIITLTPSYLASLKDGTHSLRVQFTDGRYDGSFTTPLNTALTTAAAPSVPATGGMGVGYALLALAAVLALRKRRVSAK